MSNHSGKRKAQITELQRDLNHIKDNHINVNLVVSGDFNTDAQGIKSIPIQRCSILGNTWRKSPLSKYSSQLDHVLHSQTIKLECNLRITESDHKAIVTEIKDLAKSVGIAYGSAFPPFKEKNNGIDAERLEELSR